MSRYSVSIMSLFSWQTNMIWIFLLLSIVNLPLLISIVSAQVRIQSFGGFTLGSLGQADALCAEVKIDSLGINLACESGYEIKAVTDYGLLKADSAAQIEHKCLTASIDSNARINCDLGQLYKAHLQECFGKQSCFLSTLKSLVA